VKTLHSFASLMRQTEGAEPIVQLLAALPTAQGKRVSVKNAHGSLASLLAAHIMADAIKQADVASRSESHHCLFLCPSNEEALNVLSDLQVLMGKESCVLYADSEQKLSHNAEQLDARLVSLTSALKTISHATEAARSLAIVASAESLVFTVPAPKAMVGNTRRLQRGEHQSQGFRGNNG
jgi:hypothetical protein